MTSKMHDSARSESDSRADWQTCTIHVFALGHRTSRRFAVLLVIAMFALKTMAHSFTTPLTSFGIRRIGFENDSPESGASLRPGLI